MIIERERSASMFFLFISGTEAARVPGLSAAGANPDVLPFTSGADADVIRFGRPKAIDCFPMDPEGHPTPAIITRASVLEADIPVTAVRAGSFLPPEPPYVELGASPGHDPRLESSVPSARAVFESAAAFAENSAPEGLVMLAESIPGGTTTALLVLRALGYDCMVSAASPVNPVALKERVWLESSARCGISAGGMRDDPMRAIEELGDPMQAAVCGFISGLGGRSEVVLAGGTQMLAVAACVKALGSALRMTVATTKYVESDPSSTFKKTAAEIGVETYAAPLDFSSSPYKGLADYEKGYVKEGVGAGGSVLYAARRGVDVSAVIARTNELYKDICAGAA
ncbi:MAG: TIGR00303 family protein [Synergistaceae bacterium]|jgi:uncharacterized protein (TIGR00303 family)|nr:TIGR00303 family protein [Synergistaceae bacterium]